MVLGVPPQWHLPLLLCRALSTVSAAWWACYACISIYRLVYHTHAAVNDDLQGSNSDALRQSQILKRVAVAQIALSFLWAGAAAYLAHLFASSLMARWLLHYSPFAVLVRLCSLSILLSFGCMQIFRLSAALEPDLFNLSRNLLAWITISITLMLVYFFTQQDIAVEDDRDDRQRRQGLRLKCLYVISACSLFSMLVLVCLDQANTMSWQTHEWKGVTPSLFARWTRSEL